MFTETVVRVALVNARQNGRAKLIERTRPTYSAIMISVERGLFVAVRCTLTAAATEIARGSQDDIIRALTA